MSDRDDVALSMRISGKSWNAIANALKYADQQAARAGVERALVRATVERNPEGVEQIRAVTAERIDRMLEAIWDDATDADLDIMARTTAIKTALTLVDRQATLYGVDAPKQSKVSVEHSVDAQAIEDVASRIFAAVGVYEPPVLEQSAVVADTDADMDIVEAEILDTEEGTTPT